MAVGGTLGHCLCTGLAVVGGRMVAQKISVRTGKICLVGAGPCVPVFKPLKKNVISVFLLHPQLRSSVESCFSPSLSRPSSSSRTLDSDNGADFLSPIGESLCSLSPPGLYTTTAVEWWFVCVRVFVCESGMLLFRPRFWLFWLGFFVVVS